MLCARGTVRRSSEWKCLSISGTRMLQREPAPCKLSSKLHTYLYECRHTHRMYTHEHTEHHTPNTLKISRRLYLCTKSSPRKVGHCPWQGQRGKAEGQHTGPTSSPSMLWERSLHSNQRGQIVLNREPVFVIIFLAKTSSTKNKMEEPVKCVTGM